MILYRKPKEWLVIILLSLLLTFMVMIIRRHKINYYYQQGLESHSEIIDKPADGGLPKFKAE